MVLSAGCKTLLDLVSRIGHAMTSVAAGYVEKGAANLHARRSQGRIQGV